MTAPALTTPAVSVADLLSEAAQYVAGIPTRSYMGLHTTCSQVAAEWCDLDMTTDEGHQVAVRLGDAMCRTVADYLTVVTGQHPYPDFRKTLTGWLLSERQIGVVCSEVRHAADWSRSLQQGRSL